MTHLKFIASFMLVGTCLISTLTRGQEFQGVQPLQKLQNDAVGDQDDLCFWTNGKSPADYRVIVSDKKANRIFLYALDGTLTQSIKVPKPGNIDIRQGIQFGSETMDVVAVNVRTDGWKIQLFSMDRDSMKLVPIDGGYLQTRANYGFCLAYDAHQKKLFGFCTSEEVGLTQYELTRQPNGNCQGSEVRHWNLGKCEGAVADDAAGKVYVAVETEGIWQFDIDPSSIDPPQMIIPLGKNGLEGDLEGITLAQLPDDSNALVVSSQWNNSFFVFERFLPWNYRGKFSIESVGGTDGIDLSQSDQIADFPGGVFGCHSAGVGYPIVLSSWHSIVSQMKLISNAKTTP